MRAVVEYAQKAHIGNPSDAKIKEFYETVKLEFNGDSPVEEVKSKD
jgi:hypothetical protein